MLDRLLRDDTDRYQTVEQFQADVEASNARPQEVTMDIRAQHLAVLAAVFFLPLVFVYLLVFFFFTSIQANTVASLSQRIEWNEQRLEDLEEGARTEFLLSAFQFNPLILAGALLQLDDDLRLADQVEQQIQKDRELRERWLLSLSFAAKQVAQSAEEQRQPSPRSRSISGNVRGQAHAASVPPRYDDTVLPFWIYPTLIFVIPFPCIWVVWAFLLRGGLTLPLMGISLRSSTGRKAPRILCAWRAILVWLPVVGLLSLAQLCSAWYFVSWEQEWPEARYWAYHLSWLAWGAAVALLPLYVALALRSPSRALHDRLAGTYLVPR